MVAPSEMSPWLSRFNPTPSFPSYSGRHEVGSVDFEIAASDIQNQSSPSSQPPLVPTLAFRCFYPCDPPTKPAQPVYWVQSPQKSVLSSYARFLGAGSMFSDVLAYFPRLLYWIQLPVHRDAPILPSKSSDKRWPVLVFSHGLGGSRNTYSHLCASLASYGIMVVAPEHRDGSCPISHVSATGNSTAFTVDYKRLSHKASKEVFDGRDEQLRIRLWELSQIYQALEQIDKGRKFKNIAVEDTKLRKQKTPSVDVASMFKDVLDIYTPGRVTWAGHSFGAATTVQFLKSVFYSTQNSHSHLLGETPAASLKSQITPQSPAMLLDLWALPLSSPASASLKSKPMPCFDPSNATGGASTLAILSEAFVNWSSNLRDVKAALSDPSSASTVHRRPAVNIFYPVRSAHLSQSDFGVLFPRLTKYVAKADEPERTLRLNVRAILQAMRNAGISVADTSVADLELGVEDAAISDVVVDGDSGQVGASRRDDWRILSRDPDTVRGWVALSADGAREDVLLNYAEKQDESDSGYVSGDQRGAAGDESTPDGTMGEGGLRGPEMQTANNRL